MLPDAPRPPAGPRLALLKIARCSVGAAGVACVLGALALAAPAGEAAAQQPLAFELRAGAGLPAFDLADRAAPGFAFGLDLSHRVADRVSVVAGGDVEFLPGEDVLTVGGVAPPPDLTVWHYGAGLEAQILDPRRTYWRLSLGGGAGGTTFDASDGGGSETDLSVYGNLELGYEVSREADLFLGVRSWLAFAGDDGAVSGPSGADALWSFPVTAGVRLHF